ncbi:MAG: acyltransferase [Acidobacteriota bacterium]|nr:acyltransferase [Acidobacteriota bacterium]
MVISFHFFQTFSRGPASLVGKLAVWGQTGVDLFFVLSGFLISGILLDSKGSAHYLRNFYVRRILRIFPLYYATLFVLYLAAPLLHLAPSTAWRQSLWFWVYLQNIPATFAPSLMSGPEHFWSLAVEEHYYLLWPFLVLLLTREGLLRTAGLAIAVSLVTRMVLSQYETFYFTLARLDGLAMGSALAIFARRQPCGLRQFVPWARGVFLFLGIALAGTQLLVSGKGLPVIQILKSTMVAVVYACVIVLALEKAAGRAVTKLLSGRVLGAVGKYSYGMYVLHPFILLELARMQLPYSVSGLLISMVLTFLAAWISWTVLEERFLRLKRNFADPAKAQLRVARQPA